jgi:hypothetical protein
MTMTMDICTSPYRLIRPSTQPSTLHPLSPFIDLPRKTELWRNLPHHKNLRPIPRSPRPPRSLLHSPLLNRKTEV